MVYATCFFKAFFLSFQSFPMIFDMYISGKCSLIFLNKLLYDFLTAIVCFHFFTSVSVALDVIGERLFSLNTLNIASFILEVNDPLILLCFASNC